MATECIAALLYCYTLLLKTTLLSSMYWVIIIIPYNIRISALLGFSRVISETKPQLVKLLAFAMGAPWICLE
jgi:hypothetical protein